MKSKIILGIILLSLLSLNFISASGLCLGADRYYHDCDDSRYFCRDDVHYDDYYTYHGRDYPSRDYYYRDYYKPRYKGRGYKKYYTETKYDDVEEYKRTINYKYEDRYGSQKYKTTINEKTEIELDYNVPYYVVYDDLIYGKGYRSDEYEKDYYQEDKIRQIPWTYFQYKKYY